MQCAGWKGPVGLEGSKMACGGRGVANQRAAAPGAWARQAAGRQRACIADRVSTVQEGVGQGVDTCK